jgi:hypothetical protein
VGGGGSTTPPPPKKRIDAKQTPKKQPGTDVEDVAAQFSETSISQSSPGTNNDGVEVVVQATAPIPTQQVDTILQKLLASSELRAAAKRIMNKTVDMNDLRESLKKGLIVLYTEYKSRDDFIIAERNAKKAIIAAWKKVGDGKYENAINMGNDPAEMKLGDLWGLVIKNYAPIDDCDLQNGSDETTHPNRIPDSNPCINAYKKRLLNSICREVLREFPEATPVAPNYNRIQFIDTCILALDKEDYQSEIETAAQLGGITVPEFYLFGLLMVGFHAKHYGYCNEGVGALPVIAASANARDNLFEEGVRNINSESIPHQTKLMRFYSYVPHGECVTVKIYLLRFEEESQKVFGQRLLHFYYDIHPDSSLKQLLKQGSRVYLRYSGLDFMTEDEKKELLDAIEEIIRKMHEERDFCIEAMTKAFNGEELTEDVLIGNRAKFKRGLHAAFAASKLTEDNLATICKKVNDSLTEGLSRSKGTAQWKRFLHYCRGYNRQMTKRLYTESTVKKYHDYEPKVLMHDGFTMEDVTDEEFESLLGGFKGKYAHVINAGRVCSNMELDGSNIKSVYDEIDEIFSKGVESEETITSRWRSFLQRCEDHDTSLHGKLHKERQTRASIQMRDQIRRDSSRNQQQKMMSFDMLKSNFKKS